MSTFWKWAVRWPAFAVAAASLGLGYNGAFDPEIAWAGGLVFAFAGYLAGILMRGAEARARRRREAAAIVTPPRISVIPGLKPQRERLDRAA